jgi:hypothetical protein
MFLKMKPQSWISPIREKKYWHAMKNGRRQWKDLLPFPFEVGEYFFGCFFGRGEPTISANSLMMELWIGNHLNAIALN